MQLFHIPWKYYSLVKHSVADWINGGIAHEIQILQKQCSIIETIPMSYEHSHTRIHVIFNNSYTYTHLFDVSNREKYDIMYEHYIYILYDAINITNKTTPRQWTSIEMSKISAAWWMEMCLYIYSYVLCIYGHYHYCYYYCLIFVWLNLLCHVRRGVSIQYGYYLDTIYFQRILAMWRRRRGMYFFLSFVLMAYSFHTWSHIFELLMGFDWCCESCVWARNRDVMLLFLHTNIYIIYLTSWVHI